MKALASSLLAAGLLVVGCSSDSSDGTDGDQNVMPSQQAGTTAAASAGTMAAAPAAAAGADDGAPPPSGAAGTGAEPEPAAGTMAQPMAGTTGAAGTMAIDMDTEDEGIALDECGLDTQWAGDEFCINPPPPDKGFQMHIGPSNYDNPEPRFVVEPGDEINESMSVVSGNDKDVYYYWRQYRMRPGSHHLILMAGTRRLGGTQNTAKDNPERGIIAPENQGLGMPLEAHAQLNNSLHYINYTDKPIIKEAWINFWYRDPSEVTEPSHEVFSFAPINIPPGAHVILSGTCPVMGSGRALTFYGHIHANNERFSVWRVRGGQRDLVYENYDWEHPAVVEYSSILTNTPPDAATKTPGGWNGMLDLQQGDQIYFECQIINKTSKTFRGANEALDDEMCILVGDTAGATVPRGCTYNTQQL